MDPNMQPINGISLERYAELSALVSDAGTDADAQAKIVEGAGVSRADWEAAKSGWTARMQDMSNMGRIATLYMQLYQAALANKGPVARVSFEDYVAMSAVVKLRTYEGMLATYQISQSDWTTIAGHWNQTMGQNMGQYANFHGLVDQEVARLRSGGEPKPIQIQKENAGAAPAAAPAAQGGGMGGMGGMPGMGGNPYAGIPYQAGVGMGLGGIAQSMGAALGVGIGVGTAVNVRWSDGNQYPGTVLQLGQGQQLVQFPDGRQMWIAEAHISRR
jgi:hypothetical protein